jgi:sodium-dependent dicarboxylate transporter 2/3/5
MVDQSPPPGTDPERAFARTRPVFVAAGLVGFLVVLAFGARIPDPAARRTLAMLVLMSTWWMTEAVPIHWTACLPLLAFPLLSVHPGDHWTNVREAARPYLDPNTFLFLGGMCIALAMEDHALHRRIALHILRAVGPRRLILGFLLASAFISLWISNTATAVMMVPIGLGVIRELERRGRGAGAPPAGAALLAQSIMLAIAYGANIGGIGTKIGTAPNMQFAGFVLKHFQVDIGFMDFLRIGLPFVLLFLPLAYGALAILTRGSAPPAFSGDVLDSELDALGPMSRGERAVAGHFVVACVLWIASKPLKDALGIHRAIDPLGLTAELDPLIALAVAASLLVSGLLAVSSLARLQWDALLLLGGSFSLAHAVRGSGLAAWAGDRLAAVHGLDPWLIMLAVAAATVFLSAFSSNTATTQIMLEVVSMAIGRGARETIPYLAAVTISASCDFMLPAGTPPNAIVFATGHVRLPQMARVGFVLDVLAAVVAAAWCRLAVARMFA